MARDPFDNYFRPTMIGIDLAPLAHHYVPIVYEHDTWNRMDYASSYAFNCPHGVNWLEVFAEFDQRTVTAIGQRRVSHGYFENMITPAGWKWFDLKIAKSDAGYYGNESLWWIDMRSWLNAFELENGLKITRWCMSYDMEMPVYHPVKLPARGNEYVRAATFRVNRKTGKRYYRHDRGGTFR